MSVTNYKELLGHQGHQLEIVTYGSENAALECWTCKEVLFDFDADSDEDDGQPSDLQENEDFAHDGDFDNMVTGEDGFITNDGGY